MKQFKDPFEAAYEEQEDSPPQSPIAPEGSEAQTGGVGPAAHEREDDNDTRAMASSNTENKEDDYEEEEENVEVELSKFPSSADPTKMSRSGMQSIFSQFTDEQMNRYESFRRSALKKSNMRTLLVSITGSQKISLPMTIAVSGIAKLFVGELVETARVVMTERKESGPIRPCHIREAYRRLKLEGKLPKRSAPRLFR